jgi:hypothetical protein
MSTAETVIPTRASFVRLSVLIGLALVAAAVVALPQFSASKECKGGAFSSGFSAGFDIKRCEIVVRRLGEELFKLPLPS